MNQKGVLSQKREMKQVCFIRDILQNVEIAFKRKEVVKLVSQNKTK